MDSPLQFELPDGAGTLDGSLEQAQTTAKAEEVTKGRLVNETLARLNETTEGAVHWEYRNDNALKKAYKFLRPKKDFPPLEDSFIIAGLASEMDEVHRIIRGATHQAGLSMGKIKYIDRNNEQNVPQGLLWKAIVVPSEIAQNERFIREMKETFGDEIKNSIKNSGSLLNSLNKFSFYPDKRFPSGGR